MVKISTQSELFLFLSLKTVRVNFGFLNLFLDTWIRNPDPGSEYGSGSRTQAQIECGSNRIWIRIWNTGYLLGIRIWIFPLFQRYLLYYVAGDKIEAVT